MFKGRTALVTGSTSGIGLGIARRLAAGGANLKQCGVTVVGFTKAAALAVAEHGITVNAVCPGYVRTPLVGKQIPDTAKARGITKEQVVRDVLLATQPTRQFVTVEQIAELTAFPCTQQAASITGAMLPIDGGWTAQ